MMLKSSRPKWSRGQNFGLGLKDFASGSASKVWPRPQTFGLGLASMSLSYYVIGHSGKNCVNGNFVIFSGYNLKSYVVNHYFVLFS